MRWRLELNPHIRPATFALAAARVTAVRAGDRVDDREAQPGAAARARAVATREALERGSVQRLVEAGAAVEHVQPDAAARLLGQQLDRAIAVAERVVHQVSERLLHAKAIRLQRQAVSGVHAQLASLLGGARNEAARAAGEELARVDLLRAHRQLALVRAGEHE